MKSAKKPEASAASKEKKVAAAANKTAAVKSETASKVETAKTAAAPKAPAKKPAAKKPAAKSPAKSSAKTASKTAAKAPAKSASKTVAKAPAKKAVKKAPAVTIETICDKLEKKLSKSKAKEINGKVAVDIEVWGFEDGSNARMYVEVNDGKVSVAPYPYDAKDFRVSLSFANAKAFVDGKLTLKELLDDSEGFYAEGNIVSAIKLASIF